MKDGRRGKVLEEAARKRTLLHYGGMLRCCERRLALVEENMGWHVEKVGRVCCASNGRKRYKASQCVVSGREPSLGTRQFFRAHQQVCSVSSNVACRPAVKPHTFPTIKQRAMQRCRVRVQPRHARFEALYIAE